MKFVDLEISIRNRLVKTDVEFEFSLNPPQEEFDFIGSTKLKQKLGGGQELVVPIEAVIFIDGVIDLQCVKITVFQEEGSMPYVFPLQWIVNVMNTGI